MTKNLRLPFVSLFVGAFLSILFISIEFVQFQDHIFNTFQEKKQEILAEKHHLDSFASVLSSLIMKSPDDTDKIQKLLQTDPDFLRLSPLPLVHSVEYRNHISGVVVGRLGIIENTPSLSHKIKRLQSWKGNLKFERYQYAVKSSDGKILGNIAIMVPKTDTPQPPLLGENFIGFIKKSLFKIALMIFFILSTLTIGFGLGFNCIFKSKRSIALKWKEDRQNSLNDYSQLQSKVIDLESELAGYKINQLILEDHVLRYKEIVKQTLGINKIVNQVLKQEFSSSKTGAEITSILSEVSSSLRKAQQGFLPQNHTEIICLNDEIYSLIDEFESILKQSKSTFHVVSSPSIFQEIDIDLIRTFVRQILLQITGCFLKEHIVTIEILNHQGASLVFKDNGHRFKEEPSQFSMDSLTKQANSIGWEVTYHNDGIHTVTTLYMPDHSSLLTHNIIPLFNRATYA